MYYMNHVVQKKKVLHESFTRNLQGMLKLWMQLQHTWTLVLIVNGMKRKN